MRRCTRSEQQILHVQVSGGCGSIIGSAVVMPWHDPASDCFMPSLLACDLPAVDSLRKEDEAYYFLT